VPLRPAVLIVVVVAAHRAEHPECERGKLVGLRVGPGRASQVVAVHLAHTPIATIAKSGWAALR
jgi:hypothetical protein